MVTKVEFYKKSRFIFLSLIFSFLFISCFNSFTPNPDTLSQPSERYVDISGRYSIDGALPKAIVESMYPDMQNDFSRSIDGAGTLYSAFPIIGTTNNIVEYYAFAKDADGVEQNVTGSVTVADKSFQIPHLKIGVSWIVEVGIKVKNTVAGTDTWIRCLYDISEPKTFTETDFTFNKNFLLKPDTSGTGFVDLDMNLGASFDSSIVRLECELDDDTQCDKWNSATTEEFNFSKIKMSGLPAGVYDITLYFYTSLDGGYPAYTTVQSINVISGMTTETWCSDGTSLITGTGTNTAFNLTSALINEYKKSVIYVGQTSAATSVGITAHNDNEGTAYSPLASLQGAIDRITALNAGSKAYRILVSGLVTGNTQINVSNTCASSITIDNTGNQADAAAVLQGSSLASVLEITTNVPVTIRHVQINGGYAENGGGINIGSNAKVTLGNGTLIGGTSGTVPASGESACANYAEHGGGIYSTGSLTLKSGAQVIYNYGTDGGGICCAGGSLTIEAGSKVNLNGSNTTAGGISITNTAFKMTGGEVCNNNSSGGTGTGGIYIGATCPASTVISGATISGNSADSGEAGGIRYHGEQTLTICGNTLVSNNHSFYEGGGIRIEYGILDLCDCTISGNYSLLTGAPNSNRAGGVASLHNTSQIQLSGSVYIPHGATINGVFTTGPRCNDIRQNHGAITIKGPLTASAESTNGIIAYINPNTSSTRNTVIMQADGTNVTDLTPYKEKFAFTNTDWDSILSTDKKKILITAPFYVSGQLTYPYCGAEGSSAGNGLESNPIDTIATVVDRINALNDPNADYTILIDGEVFSTYDAPNSVGQRLGTVVAHSITIAGVNGLDENGQPKDIINGISLIAGTPDSARRARPLTISTSVPVTIECLKITGGLADEGGGIYLAGSDADHGGNLTLGNDLLITGNTAKKTDAWGLGGGIFITSNSTLKVKGNVAVTGNLSANTSEASTVASNVYLQSGQTITVAGALVNSTDSTKKANIGISTSTAPTLTSTIAFTANYGTYNSGIAPGTYFTGDQWTVAWGSGTTAYEAVLAASGGNITVEPIYEDITVNVDKFSVLKSATEKKFNFSASGTDSEGNTSAITIGSGEGQLNLIIDSVTYHGETVPASYYDKGTNYVTLGNSMPAGNYTINTRAVYQGSLSAARTYSADFEVKIIDGLVVTASNIASLALESGKKYYLAVDSSVTDSELESLLTKIRENPDIGESTLDLSAMELSDGMLTTKITLEDANITEIIIPDNLLFLNPSLADQFANNTKLVTVTYNGTNKINWNNFTFAGCTSLKKFPWQTIWGGDAGNANFANCTSLESAVIPEGLYGFLTFFRGCTNLKEIHFLDETPPLLDVMNLPYGNVVFAECHEDLIFYVPNEAARQAYLSATDTNGFANPACNSYATTPENLAAHVRVEGQ